MSCRICGSMGVRLVGHYEPYIDYGCAVYDCNTCGCRYAPYDKSVYERLHCSEGSTYSSHKEMASKVEVYFNRKDVRGLGRYLSNIAKNRFIIDTIIKRSNIRKILEIGCSKGYLTSYFILRGYDIIGMDIAPTAVREANRRFGACFFTPDDPAINGKAPYDAIYFVGTVGCVDSPVDLINYAMSMLKPSGVLLFNAPFLAACLETGKIWGAGTSPPDLVTLFPKRFWTDNFMDAADVDIHLEPNEPLVNVSIFLRSITGISRKEPPKRKLFMNRVSGKPKAIKTLPSRVTLKVLKIISELISHVGMCPQYISESGMHVVMRKK